VSFLAFGIRDVIAKTLQRSQRLIVSLDVPADQAPEYLCIVSESRSCPDGSEDSNGDLIHEADCTTRELSDLQDIGSLPADLSAGDASIAAPQREVVLRRYKDRSEIVRLDSDLVGALRSVSRRSDSTCEEMHEGCTPKVRLSAFSKSGRIICGRDGSVIASAHTGRVAIVALSYHEGESRSGVQKVELHGTSATLLLQKELIPSNFAFAQVIGGDYAFSATTSIGTNERIIVTLHPRCTLVGVELPTRPLVAPLAQGTLHLDSWGAKGDSAIIAQCIPNVHRTTLPFNVPYLDSLGTKRLTVTAGGDLDPIVLEATWSGALPPTPLRLAHRRFEFVWRRSCLAGEWPASEPGARDASWNVMCPRATVEGVSGCTVVDQADNKSICKYRCEVADSVPAVLLPASVQFDRMRTQGGQVQILYSWHDTVSYSGQELQSFVLPPDRTVTLEFADPRSWQDRSGDTLDEIQVAAPDGSLSHVDLTSQGSRELLPSWISISTPNITCSSRLRVAVLGASTYGEQSLAVAGGRIVLGHPHSLRPPWLPWLMLGGGILGVPSERSSALYVPKRSTPYATLGGAVERYLDRWPAAVEFRGLFHVSKSIFGAVKNTSAQQGDLALGRVWYVRLDLGVNVVWWWSRQVHVGAGIGFGVGHPTSHDDVARVGATRVSFVTELIDLQARLSRGVWLDFAIGIRWAEEHNYFTTRFFDDPAPGEIRLNNWFFTTRVRL